MKCFVHPDREVAATCVQCNKGLCHACASVYRPCLCSDCAKERNYANTTGEVKSILIKQIIFFVVSFVVLKLLFSSQNPSLTMLLGLSLPISGIPWGWSLLSRLIPITLFGSSTLVMLYYFLKLFAAYFIGLFVMVWNVGKMAYLYYKGKKFNQYIDGVKEQLEGSQGKDS